MKIDIKKALEIGAGVLTIAVISILVIFNQEDEFGNFLKDATDEELDIEREKARLDFCNPDLDDDYRISCESKLSAFDTEISNRAWGDQKPQDPSYHREHGWYLQNDD